MAHHTNDAPEVTVLPKNKEQINRILKVTVILSVVTAIEFVFAFMMDSGTLRTAIFLGLTIVKAFYIVAEFMHLKHEVKILIWAILIPLVTIVWLLVALMVQTH